MDWGRGTPFNPIKVAPSDWHDNGLPYGAYCECYKCGTIERSTVLFDYYADNPGDRLACETCTTGRMYEAVKPVFDRMQAEGEFDGIEDEIQSELESRGGDE